MSIKTKNMKSIILRLLIFSLSVFLFQQVYVYMKTGKSHIFAYRGSVTPKDYSYILSDIRHSLAKLTFTDDTYRLPTVESLCKALDNLEPAEKQPLKRYGIKLIYNKETMTTYLYGERLNTIFPEEKFPYWFSDELYVILLINKAVGESPKGVYHGFKLSEYGNHWLGITTQMGGINTDSTIPPVPGCIYNVIENKIYVPLELLPVYGIIYPNLEIPSTFIFESTKDAALSQ